MNTAITIPRNAACGSLVRHHFATGKSVLKSISQQRRLEIHSFDLSSAQTMERRSLRCGAVTSCPPVTPWVCLRLAPPSEKKAAASCLSRVRPTSLWSCCR
eukprot:scaffold1638_cov258-Pinguiococcus_pyrenoidosus.AAC.26